jgi:hypothetical protein
MKHRSTSLLLTCLLLIAPTAWAKPAERDSATLCKTRLAAIGRALTAYQRDHGRLPAHLSDLWPRYVRERQAFHCPADRLPPSLGHRPAAADPRLPVSYSFEMSAAQTSMRPLQLGPESAGATWRAQKTAQRVNFGDRVPVVRCWHHARGPAATAGGRVLNLTLSGQVYASSAQWEMDPETVPVVLARMERDAAAGWPQFRRRWDPKQLSLYFSRLRPTPALRRRLAATANRLAARAGKQLDLAAGDERHVVELLYRAADDPAQADRWRDRWVDRFPTAAPPCG